MSEAPAFASIDDAVTEYLNGPDINTDTKEENRTAGPEPLEYSDDEGDSDPQDTGEPTPDEDQTSEDDGEDDGEETPDENQTSLEAPEYWKPEARAEFDKLPDNLKAILVEQDQHAKSVIGTKLTEATQATQAATNQISTWRQHADQMEKELERVGAFLSRKYDGLDLNNLRRHNPVAYAQVTEEMDSDKAAVAHYQQVKAQADQLHKAAFLRDEHANMAQLAQTDPVARELNDPTVGPALKGEVAEFLKSRGVTEDRFDYITASELIMATEAMKYRQGKVAAAAKINKSQKPNQAQGQRARAPTQSPQSSGSVSEKKAFEKLARSGSMDDAVNAYMARNRNRNR